MNATGVERRDELACFGPPVSSGAKACHEEQSSGLNKTPGTNISFS